MNEQRYDTKFTASDIERYHQGLLSPQQMHALEKAALDDPFLADALEGYALPANTSQDISDLQQRLAARLQKGTAKRVIALGSGKTSFNWLRAAAMIVAVVGAALLVYQFGFNQHSQKTISENRAVNENETSPTPAVPASPDSLKDDSVLSPPVQKDTIATPVNTQNNAGGTLAREHESLKADQQDFAKAAASEQMKAKAERKSIDNNAGFFAEPKTNENKVAISPVTGKIVNTAQADKPDARAEMQVADSVVHGYAAYNRKLPVSSTNIFRGQVMDANNNALPFANITNVTDHIGTYSDAKGRFVLTSPDSVLNVQVRSIGFANSNQQLRNTVNNNQIVLQEDNGNLNEVVLSKQRINSTRARQQMVLEEPEPADGWEKYDTYLANNIQVPESYRSKETDAGITEVELSFEVNAQGKPMNIKVERSLCEKCNEEAIRLLRDGPKWKRKKAKKGRTKVTISF